MKLFGIYLTEKENEKVKRESKETGLSKSEIIRRAIDKYFERGFPYTENQDVEKSK